MEKLTIQDIRHGNKDNCHRMYVRKSKLTDHADAFFTVYGDGMSPIIHDGDMVAIAFEDTLEPGAIGMFLVDGQIVLRQYYPDGLRAFRPELSSVDISCKEGYQIVGRFITVITEDMLPNEEERAILEEAM